LDFLLRLLDLLELLQGDVILFILELLSVFGLVEIVFSRARCEPFTLRVFFFFILLLFIFLLSHLISFVSLFPFRCFFSILIFLFLFLLLDYLTFGLLLRIRFLDLGLSCSYYGTTFVARLFWWLVLFLLAGMLSNNL